LTPCQAPCLARLMALKITIYKNDDNDTRTDEIIDSFTVQGEVVELITSGNCEMTFVLADGTRIESTDIG